MFNQPYLTKSFKEDDFICLAGKVSLYKEGIYLNNPTYEKINEASLILLIDEISDSAESINVRANSIRELLKETEKRLLILINKTDLSSDGLQLKLEQKIRLAENDKLLFISAKEKTGLDELRSLLNEMTGTNLSSDEVIITNIRHYEALMRVSESLGRVLS